MLVEDAWVGHAEMRIRHRRILRKDARLLRQAMIRAVRKSPGSFLKTTKEIKRTDWNHEIRSSTWVVALRGREVVGIACAKRPDAEQDSEDAETSRYIGSVWIAPDFRGNRMAERLIQYLLDTERRKNQSIKQFLLWVFDTNDSAIKLYERVGFRPTGEENPVEFKPAKKGIAPKVEIKYCLDFDAEAHAALHRAVNDAARHADVRRHRVTYRVLGPRSPGYAG